MKTGSGICKSCGIGQQDPLLAINQAAEAIEREINTGEYTLSSIPSLTRNFRETAVARIETPIQRQIRLYGEEEFYTAVASINAYFEKPEIKEILQRESGTLQQYPRVRERVEISPLSPIEVTAFMDQYQYIPRTLTRQSNILSEKLIKELENFYTNNISESVVGGFCALMPNIFAAIDTFFTALSDIRNFINQVRDFAANFQENLQNLINQIRDQVLETVTRVVEDIRNVIENFTIENIIEEVTTFVENRIMSQFYELRERALSFFSEFNIENIRNRIRGIIDYVSRVFQNPTLEDIQYLIYRLCNLASFIENSFNELLNPLQDFRNNLQNSLSTLRGRSFLNTAGAIAAGGIRFDDDERERRRREAPTAPTAPAISTAPAAPAWGPLNLNIIPPTQAERNNITQWNDGGGDSRIYFARNGSFFPIGACADFSPGRRGWEGVHIDVRVMIMRVQAEFGRRLRMQSGLRPIEYNDCLRRNGVGAARNSLHINGQALDVSWDGFNSSSMEEFIEIARRQGFRGIGRYLGSSFVHVDVGPTREW